MTSCRRTTGAFAGVVLLLGALTVTVAAPGPARAESLDVLLPYVIENHDRVRAAKARLSAARNRAREALGDWYPTLSQTFNVGHENQNNDGGTADTSTGFHEYDLSLTQLLWDFGSTNASVNKARMQVEEARHNLVSARQALILEAISAYMDVIRTHAAVGFARESEANIRRQTGLEEALVGLGSGFSTDVLQAKTQLAGAQARLAQSEGALSNALNRYKAVFGRLPDDIEKLEPVPYPAPYLPVSLQQATDIAMEGNPALKNAILAADIAEQDVRIAKADNFFPRIEATGERKFKNNVGGTLGSEQELLAKVEMTFDFNLGFTAVNTLKASEEDLSATAFTAADTRRNIEEQVRNAWQQHETAKQTAAHLGNQANIAAAFLELARNERQLGRRSLIDVLSGETNLINARSDALSAETDVLVAAYGVLSATGQLEYDVVRNSIGSQVPKAVTPRMPTATNPEQAPSPPQSEPAGTGPESRLIDPDTTVAASRSVRDLLALMTETDATPAPPSPMTRDWVPPAGSIVTIPLARAPEGDELAAVDIDAPADFGGETTVAIEAGAPHTVAVRTETQASPMPGAVTRAEPASGLDSLIGFFQRAAEAAEADTAPTSPPPSATETAALPATPPPASPGPGTSTQPPGAPDILGDIIDFFHRAAAPTKPDPATVSDAPTAGPRIDEIEAGASSRAESPPDPTTVAADPQEAPAPATSPFADIVAFFDDAHRRHLADVTSERMASETASPRSAAKKDADANPAPPAESVADTDLFATLGGLFGMVADDVPPYRPLAPESFSDDRN